jgi:hypothetical protein
MDPMTIAACVSGATRAYNMVAKCVNAGREIQDTAQFFGQFFENKEKISELEQTNKHGPRFLRSKSIEAQALEIQMAKHKTEQMEKQLRELCMYTVGIEFYEEMMKTRRRLRQEKMARAKAKAEKRRLMIDGTLIVGAALISLGIVLWTVRFIMSYSN